MSPAPSSARSIAPHEIGEVHRTDRQNEQHPSPQQQQGAPDLAHEIVLKWCGDGAEARVDEDLLECGKRSMFRELSASICCWAWLDAGAGLEAADIVQLLLWRDRRTFPRK